MCGIAVSLAPTPPDISGVARPPDLLQRYSSARNDVMNDRQWDVSAYAALMLVFVGAIATAVVIVDQLVHTI
jgi:hypothetical protein